jgi:hypothetical protein
MLRQSTELNVCNIAFALDHPGFLPSAPEVLVPAVETPSVASGASQRLLPLALPADAGGVIAARDRRS